MHQQIHFYSPEKHSTFVYLTMFLWTTSHFYHPWTSTESIDFRSDHFRLQSNIQCYSWAALPVQIIISSYYSEFIHRLLFEWLSNSNFPGKKLFSFSRLIINSPRSSRKVSNQFFIALSENNVSRTVPSPWNVQRRVFYPQRFPLLQARLYSLDKFISEKYSTGCRNQRISKRASERK